MKPLMQQSCQTKKMVALTLYKLGTKKKGRGGSNPQQEVCREGLLNLYKFWTAEKARGLRHNTDHPSNVKLQAGFPQL